MCDSLTCKHCGWWILRLAVPNILPHLRRRGGKKTDENIETLAVRYNIYAQSVADGLRTGTAESRTRQQKKEDIKQSLMSLGLYPGP